MEKIAVAIVFFQKLEQTIECVKSVYNNHSPIYILNNNSEYSDFITLKQVFKGYNYIEYIESPINLGPARGRNLLLSIIKEKWILFIDNDITVINDNWHNILLNHINGNVHFDVFIPRLYNVHESKFSNYHSYRLINRTLDPFFNHNGIINWFPGGASCINSILFEKIGYYAEDLTVLEDFEIAIRAISKNVVIKALLIDDLILFHDHRFSLKRQDQFAARVRYKSSQYVIAEKFITDKYDFIFYSGWKPWVDEQLALFVSNSLESKLKLLIAVLISRLKKYFFT